MADNEAAMYELDAQIARLQAVANLPRLAAPACAAELRVVMERQVNAGVNPQGEEWAPRKKDGAQPMQNAAQALTVVPIGSKVFARLKGVEVLHHRGLAKGGVKRVVIPTREVPMSEPMVRAILSGLEETFDLTMGGVSS